VTLLAVLSADILGADMVDFVNIKGNAALVPSAGPLWVESSGLLVLIYIDGLVQLVESGLFPPVLGVLELLERFLRDELPRSEVAE